jgi:hypothetical protein
MSDAQVVALERAKREKEAHGELESECLGCCAAPRRAAPRRARSMSAAVMA